MKTLIIFTLLAFAIIIESASFQKEDNVDFNEISQDLIASNSDIDNDMAHSNNSFTDEKVYRGNAVERNAFPFIVALYQQGHFCGATILGPNHLLTAAHCLTHLEQEKTYFAYAGLHDYNGPYDGVQESTFTKNSITIHPNYDDKSLRNDIAIIRLDKAFSGTKSVTKICIGAAQRQATIAGWGYSTCSRRTSNVILQATGTVLTNQQCSQKVQNMASTKVCVQYRDQSMLMGDSGGPIFQVVNGKYQQIGLSSYILNYNEETECPDTNMPNVYTRVNQFTQNFIEPTVGFKVSC